MIRLFLWVGLVLGNSCAHVQAVDDPAPLNILWIIAEDLSPDLGCDGTPQVETPNLDRLAREGVRFTRAFATSPVCSASRSAFMTGMYSTTIGTHNHRSHRNDGYVLPEGVQVITDWLRPHGYFTAIIRRVTDEQGKLILKGAGKTDWNFTYTGKPFDTNRWRDLSAHEPFYAQINLNETRRGEKWNNAHTMIEHPADPARVKLPPYYPDHPVARQDWAQYLNAVMALDLKVGLLLEQLEVDGLANRTVVIFLGDHGRAMLRGKQWCYDSGLQVPLIIRWPDASSRPEGLGAAGTIDDRLVELIDLAPTTLAIAGVEKPSTMQGRRMFGPHADPVRKLAFAARDRCDETVFRIRSVRDSRYRYIHNGLPERPFLQFNRYKENWYPMVKLMRELYAQGELNELQAVLMRASRPAEELYDTMADPYETVNLIDAPEHAKAKIRLQEALRAWIDQTHDQGQAPEPSEVVEYCDNVLRERFNQQDK